MNSLRLLIVDDEPLIRASIRDGLRDAHGIESVRECGSGEEAIQVLSTEHIDLVLLDVQMQGLSGLDVVQRIGAARMPAVIFITAFDEYAVKAFELNALDYLLKPFDTERLLRSIERAFERLREKRHTELSDKLQALLNSRARTWPDRIVVKGQERYDFLPTKTIDWIEAADNYAILHCGSRQHMVAEGLASLESRLNPALFLRIHRGRIVNLSQIVAINPLLSGTYQIELRGGTRLTSGRQYRGAIQAILRG
jgi:two-component system LytT family response regulator